MFIIINEMLLARGLTREDVYLPTRIRGKCKQTL